MWCRASKSAWGDGNAATPLQCASAGGSPPTTLLYFSSRLYLPSPASSSSSSSRSLVRRSYVESSNWCGTEILGTAHIYSLYLTPISSPKRTFVRGVNTFKHASVGPYVGRSPFDCTFIHLASSCTYVHTHVCIYYLLWLFVVLGWVLILREFIKGGRSSIYWNTYFHKTLLKS